MQMNLLVWMLLRIQYICQMKPVLQMVCQTQAALQMICQRRAVVWKVSQWNPSCLWNSSHSLLPSFLSPLVIRMYANMHFY